MTPNTAIINEMLRFFSVSVLGVLLDIAIAFALATLLGLPLWIATASGFVIAASANYALHEIWTFKHGPKALSKPRAFRYLITSLITLLVRIGVVALFEAVFQGQYILANLLFGAGASFLANFALSKHFVFTAYLDRSK